MTEAVLNSGDLAWGIVGAGMQSSGMRDALAPQDCLYAVAEIGADFERISVVGAIVDVGRRRRGCRQDQNCWPR
jgi:fructuronate reductase